MAKHDDDSEIRHEGAKTIYRGEKDDVSGGRDKSVQTEALGAEGTANLSNAGSSSGGAAGRIEDVEGQPAPGRAADGRGR
jgi:hypothetical protein